MMGVRGHFPQVTVGTSYCWYRWYLVVPIKVMYCIA
ncbi:hypothetical protein BofuT4_uP106630.1 [Botrytis cinerea T4]|uniref:Uncharacterized protein n=1 Tax=Botryotinia fuckeliana (strain T4) TaxID=999810 RepID=G2Y6M7_BOTF4|nr:hypothetical protein BofuT4_uP106630.1 [Botrytis cinerea T4]